MTLEENEVTRLWESAVLIAPPLAKKYGYTSVRWRRTWAGLEAHRQHTPHPKRNQSIKAGSFQSRAGLRDSRSRCGHKRWMCHPDSGHVQVPSNAGLLHCGSGRRNRSVEPPVKHPGIDEFFPGPIGLLESPGARDAPRLLEVECFP